MRDTFIALPSIRSWKLTYW